MIRQTNIIYQKITVDIAENNLQPVVYVKQGDTARGIEIALTNSGAPFRPQADGTITVNIKKADGTVGMLSANLTDEGTIKAEFSAQTLAVAGRAIGDVAIYAADGSLLSSFLFFVRVVESAVSGDEIISSDEYAALADLLAKLENADETADNALSTAQEALGMSLDCSQAEAERVKNETARQSAETARAEEYAQISEQLSAAIGDISTVIQAAADIKALYEKMNVVLYADENGDLWIDEATEVK
nr:MAG TPA: Baseplate component [Caudoviricetes sp.]